MGSYPDPVPRPDAPQGCVCAGCCCDLGGTWCRNTGCAACATLPTPMNRKTT